MPVDLRETRLPGIGYKLTFSTERGSRISVILHNDGQREIYYYARASNDEPTAVIDLDDDEARQLGAVLGGTYERPRIVEELEMALGDLDAFGADAHALLRHQRRVKRFVYPQRQRLLGALDIEPAGLLGCRLRAIGVIEPAAGI